MLTAGSGIGVGIDPVAAAEAAVEAALAPFSSQPVGVSAGLVLATTAWGNDLQRVLDASVAALGTDCIAGGSICGVIHGGREVAHNPAVGVLALGGIDAEVALLDELVGDEERVGEELAARLSGGPRAEDLILVFPDSQSLHSGPLLSGLESALAPARILGVGASELHRGRPRVWAGEEQASGAVSALMLRLARPAQIGIAEGGCPISEPLSVTRAQGNWILGLEGRPALEVYREAAREPLASDLARASRSIAVALPAEGKGEAGAECLRIRNVVGFDLERGGLAIPQAAEPLGQISLVRIDATVARENLAALVGEAGDQSYQLGLYFGCHRRSDGLGEMAGVEAAYLERIAAPLLGCTGPFQIGSVAPGAAPALLTYAGALALASR